MPAACLYRRKEGRRKCMKEGMHACSLAVPALVQHAHISLPRQAHARQAEGEHTHLPFCRFLLPASLERQKRGRNKL